MVKENLWWRDSSRKFRGEWAKFCIVTSLSRGRRERYGSSSRVQLQRMIGSLTYLIRSEGGSPLPVEANLDSLNRDGVFLMSFVSYENEVLEDGELGSEKKHMSYPLWF